MIYLYVALGGAIGAMLRFGVSQSLPFPFGTLAVNGIGSFVMGVAFVWFSAKLGDRIPMMIMAGGLGAFTTFSTFSLDVFKLFQADRVGAALAYAGGSLILLISALFIGVILAKGLVA